MKSGKSGMGRYQGRLMDHTPNPDLSRAIVIETAGTRAQCLSLKAETTGESQFLRRAILCTVAVIALRGGTISTHLIIYVRMVMVVPINLCRKRDQIVLPSKALFWQIVLMTPRITLVLNGI
jgi:hypothetical protein